MYLVKIFDGIEDKQGTVIHSPFINNLKVSSGVVTQVLNAVDDFTFSINLMNPAWGKIRPLTTLVKVMDMRKNKTIFHGRVLQPNGSMSDNGLFARIFESESILAYLRDSSQRHAEIHDTTVREFFEIIINNHNKQVETHKRFKVGRVTVTNTTDNVYRYLGYDNTFDTIKDKLIDRLGGYLVIREEPDGNYLDYLQEIGSDIDKTPIRLSHNMKSMSYEIDPTEVITRLVPLGMSLESEDEGATDASQARLTIESVNNGIDFLDDLELQKEFGIIEKPVVWDDVTTPDRLLYNGKQFLKDQKAASVSYTVDATNLDLIGQDLNSYEVGNRYPLINPVLSVNEKIQVIEKKTDILTPQKSSLKIGDKYRTLTQYQNELRKSQRNVADLQSTVAKQSTKIGTLSVELKSAKEELEQTRQQLANFENITDQDIATITNSINTISDSIQQLEQVVDDLQSVVTPAEIQQMKSDIQSNKEGIRTNVNSITTINEQILTINSEIESIKQRLDNGGL